MAYERDTSKGSRGKDFKAKVAQFRRKVFQLGGAAAMVVIPLKEALPFQKFAPDTDNLNKNGQTIKARRITRAGQRNPDSEYTYKNKDGSSISAQDRKTGLHSPPPIDSHEGGDVNVSQWNSGLSLAQGDSSLILPIGIQLAGGHDQVIARNLQKQTEAEEKTAFEAEVNQIRLLDRMAQMIGLDTAPVTESLLAMAQMNGDNLHFLTEAKAYLTETLQKDGPRAFADIPPAQIADMANQLKWNDWGKILPELQGVSQRALHQAREMGDELAQMMGNAENTLDDIKGFINAMADVFKQHPGLIFPTVLYAGSIIGLGDGIRRMIKSKGKLDRTGLIETNVGSILAMLGCGFTAALTPAPVASAPSDLTSMPATEISPTIVPSPTAFIASTPTSVSPDSFVNPVGEVNQALIIDTASQGNTYKVDTQTLLVVTSPEQTLGVGDKEAFETNIKNLVNGTPDMKGLKGEGKKIDLILVETNGLPGDANQSTYLALGENKSGEWTLYWRSVTSGSQTFLAVRPSEPFYPVDIADKKTGFTDIKLPPGSIIGSVTVEWLGDSAIIQVADAEGDVFVMNWNAKDPAKYWEPLTDRPNQLAIDNGDLSTYTTVFHTDKKDWTTGIADFKAIFTPAEGERLANKTIRDPETGIPLFVKYQNTDGSWGDWQQSLETQKTSIETATTYADTLTRAGIKTSVADLLSQGYAVTPREVVDPKDITKKLNYDVAYIGDQPLMIRMEGGEWDGKDVLKQLIVLEDLDLSVSLPEDWYFKGSRTRELKLAAENFNGVAAQGLYLLWNKPPADRTEQDFRVHDEIFTYAKANNLDSVFGLHLLWGYPQVVPDWLNGLNKTELLTNIEEHVTQVVTRYPTVDTWSVVNEPYRNSDGITDFWGSKFPNDYSWIEAAFIAANKANPDAKLILNDFGMEIPGTIGFNQSKVQKLLDIGQQLKKDNIPVSGIGFQMHMYAKDFSDPAKTEQLMQAFTDNIKKFQEVYGSVEITEFDVIADPNNPEAQAAAYEAIMRTAIKNGITKITIFGVDDADSWKPNDKPVLFDQTRNPKLAYFALLKGILEAETP